MQRVVEIEKFESDSNIEFSLRPTLWSEYIGQKKIKKNFQVFIEASRKREKALDHIIFLVLLGLAKQL